MRVFRIAAARYADSLWSGHGASLAGGRWNPPGIPLIYSSWALSLAMLERLVNIDPTLAPRDNVYASAEVPDSHIETAPADLDVRTRSVTQAWGRTWTLSARSLAVRVPTVLVPDEWNVLLNPTHPAFNTLKFNRPQKLTFDHRLYVR